MSAPPVPLVAAQLHDDDTRFEVSSHLEIAATMRKLAERRALITAYGDSADAFIITAVMAVLGHGDEIVFDFGAERAMTERILYAERARFVSQLDHIRIEFTAAGAEEVIFEGGPAFRIPMPATMTRLQRRENYRIRIPLGRPLRLELVPDAAQPAATIATRVLDLSCGGVALGDVPAGFAPSTESVFRDCRIVLPGLETVTTDLRIVRVQPDATRPGAFRLAAQFLHLSGSAMLLLQRYINRVEREQITR